MDVQDVEHISHETALDGTCPGCERNDRYPALVRDARNNLGLDAYCDDCLHSEVLA